MKKVLLLLAVLLTFLQSSFAQWVNVPSSTNITNTNAGNVGIGTASPLAPLDVAGNQIHLGDPATTPTANYSYFKTSGTTFNTQTLTIGTTYGYSTAVDA